MNRSHRTSIKRAAIIGRSGTGPTPLRSKLAGHRVRSAVAKAAPTVVPSGVCFQGGQLPHGGLPVSWIFLDPSLSDAEAWLEPLEGEVVHLDPSRQGLEQMAGWLHGQTNVQSVHLLTCGSAGFMTLGSSLLDAPSLGDQHGEALAVIAGALSPQAQIHLHGVDLSADAAGLALMHQLSCITGACVVVSGNGRTARCDLPVRELALDTPANTPVHGSVGITWGARAQRSFCIGAIPLHGMLLVQADGAWSYTPDDAFIGQDSFSIVVLEGLHLKDTVSVQVDVLCPAAMPGEAAASHATRETAAFVDIDVEVLAAPGLARQVTAIDGQSVQADEVVSVNRGQVVAGLNGSLVFLPAPDFMGATTFACTVTDALGGIAEVQIQVETLDDLVQPASCVPSQAGTGSDQGDRMRSALLDIFDSASPGLPARFLAAMSGAEGLRLAQPEWPPTAPDVTL